VTVEIDCSPHGRSDPQSDVRRAQRELDGDLEKCRTFVMRRCGVSRPARLLDRGACIGLGIKGTESALFRPE